MNNDELESWKAWINDPNWATAELKGAFMAGRDSVKVNKKLLDACKAVVEEDGFRGSCIMRKRIDAMREAIEEAEKGTS